MNTKKLVETLNAAGLEGRPLDALADALQDVDNANREVARAVDAVERTCQSVREALSAGLNLNPLGELQSRGPGLDVAVATRQERVQNLVRLCALLGVNAREVLACAD